MKTKNSFLKNCLTLIVILINCNGFSQWKTVEANNIKDDIIITYEVIYDRELSLQEKNSAEFLSEIVIAFNKNTVIERRFGDKLKPFNNFGFLDYENKKGYNCSISTNSKNALSYDFKNPNTKVAISPTDNSKQILEFPCEKGTVIINNTPKEIFYTKKIGLRYCKQFDVDGFILEYPGYNKNLGHYTIVAKKITHTKLAPNYFSLANFTIQTEEEYTKKLEESKQKIHDTRMKFIGEKAETFKEISINQKKIDTKKINGEIIVYNFWFTTCGPCKMEIPKLNELKEKYKNKNIHFIAIALDPEYKITPFLEQYPINYEIIPEGRWIAEKFGVSSYPTNIIVDKEGTIQFYEIGYKTDILERMSNTLDKYLN
ncbi:TlpA family protein disulfide reductase [Flavobacterium flavipallidum]|uniref:TlpA disulfide reductase family protein n=1 Tax=Flavobacterium flavipallidum TaxID=3139140 RepID=A0ABU9HNM0_9FLAO